jgi:hypothetical protein
MNSFALSSFEKMKSRIAFGGDGRILDASICGMTTLGGAILGYSGGTIGIAVGAIGGFITNEDCYSVVYDGVTGAFSASSSKDSNYNAMDDGGWTGGSD